MHGKQLLKSLFNNILLGPFNLRLYSTRAFGRDLVQDIRNIIGSPGVMLDVGANVGQTVETWKREFKHSEIHSFEPVKRLFDQLAKRHGRHAVCNHLGIGSEQATLKINYGRHDVSHSFIHDQEGKGGEDVQVTTLDAYCAKNLIQQVSVLKIDVEGFEHEVIKGAAKLLTEQRVDLLVVELGVEPNGYYIFYPEFAARMRDLGYSTVGFYDQTCSWDGAAELLFCNVLFARKGLTFAASE